MTYRSARPKCHAMVYAPFGPPLLGGNSATRVGEPMNDLKKAAGMTLMACRRRSLKCGRGRAATVSYFTWVVPAAFASRR
jgi:hypothetical protein